MKPPPFDYAEPQSVPEAIDLLARYGEDGKLLAGGQSLVPLLNLRLAQPSVLIDLNRLPDLDFIRSAEMDGRPGIAIGAMTRHRTVEHTASGIPLLQEAIGWVGHPQIRNRGTVGGSIAHADPAAELPLVFRALDGIATVHSTRGARTIPAAEFFRYTFTPALDPDELLTGIWLPTPPSRSGQAFLEVARRHGDFALVAVAVEIALDGDGAISSARIAIGGAAPVPIRAVAAEVALRGQRPNAALFQEVGAIVAGETDPSGDVHADAEYRREVAGTLAARALQVAFERITAWSPPVETTMGGEWEAATRRTDFKPQAPQHQRAIELTVNGVGIARTVSVRLLLSDFLRSELGLTGTHLGCEHGVCGCCTIQMDGQAVRSCLLFAVQADGHELKTVEGLAPANGVGNGAIELHPIQQAFRDEHALQCGFCTPGFLMTLEPFLREHPDPSPEQIRRAISGNLCRCTGYQNIVKAVQRAARNLHS